MEGRALVLRDVEDGDVVAPLRRYPDGARELVHDAVPVRRAGRGLHWNLPEGEGLIRRMTGAFLNDTPPPTPEGEGGYNLRRSKWLRVYPAFTGFIENPRIKLRTVHRSSQPPFFSGHQDPLLPINL